MPRSTIVALVLAAATAAVLLPPGSGRPLEGRAPTTAELTPSVEDAFTRESYMPGATAKLVISNAAPGIRMQILRSGPERVVSRSDVTMNGVPVSPKRSIRASTGRRTVDVRIGAWPSGLYFARLRAADGRVGFAPFVVGPRRLGEHRVAVVMPTLTWQAYTCATRTGTVSATPGTRTGGRRPFASAVPI